METGLRVTGNLPAMDGVRRPGLVQAAGAGWAETPTVQCMASQGVGPSIEQFPLEGIWANEQTRNDWHVSQGPSKKKCHQLRTVPQGLRQRCEQDVGGSAVAGAGDPEGWGSEQVAELRQGGIPRQGEGGLCLQWVLGKRRGTEGYPDLSFLPSSPSCLTSCEPRWELEHEKPLGAVHAGTRVETRRASADTARDLAQGTSRWRGHKGEEAEAKSVHWATQRQGCPSSSPRAQGLYRSVRGGFC